MNLRLQPNELVVTLLIKALHELLINHTIIQCSYIKIVFHTCVCNNNTKSYKNHHIMYTHTSINPTIQEINV